jgi:hypothetical protein
VALGQEQALRRAKITLAYAAATDPAGWLTATPSAPAPKGFAVFHQQFHAAGFPDTDLADGNAISTHDAILAIVDAVTTSEQFRTDLTLPSAGDVRSNLLNLNGKNCVLGAGGTIAFGDLPDAGNPVGKPIPVLTIPSDPTRAHAHAYTTSAKNGATGCT